MVLKVAPNWERDNLNFNSNYNHIIRNNTILSLKEIINGDVNVIFYYFNDIVPSSLRNIS